MEAASEHAACDEKPSEHDQSDEMAFLVDALSLLSDSDSLLTQLAGVDPKISSELKSMVDYYDVPVHELMIRILEHPTELGPLDMCPNLSSTFRSMYTHSYAKQMQRGVYNKKDRDNDAVREQRIAYQRKQELRDIVEIARCCRRRDVHCIPNITMMKSIENIFINQNTRAWNRSTRDLDTVSRQVAENAVRSVRRWKPAPVFAPTYDDVVSTRYGYGVYDNLEFRLPVDEARVVDGVLHSTSILHTTTCECDACILCVMNIVIETLA